MDTTNRSKGKRKGNSNGAKTITGQDISWFEDSCDKTPVAFFDKFGILKCEDGYRRYARALRQSDMCEQERTLLINNFEAWKNSESLIYWERRNTKAVAKKSAWKTAGNMISGSEPFVETIIAENAKEQRQHSAVPSDTASCLQHTASDLRHTASYPKCQVCEQGPCQEDEDYNDEKFAKEENETPRPLARIGGYCRPSEETKDIEKDPERKKLYGLAWRHLRDAKVALGQQNADKETCLHFRDAFVALSGVFNLYSFMARKALSSADCLDAKGLCLVPELEYKDEELTKLLDSLKTTKTRKLTAVLEDVYSWLSSKPTFRLFLLVLRNIIENILNPHHGDNKPPECDALLIWGSILKDGRPKGTPFTFYLGDQASRATRVSKSKLACALNTGCSARKCDCTLSIGKIQFGNGEAKRASTPPVAVKVQLRKNIKIAQSVMLELSKFGLDCLQADVFRVVPWKGVYVAAPACDPIVLPTTEAAWNSFIENTAHHLKNLLEYYHEYAVDAKEKIDVFNYTQNTVGQEEEGG
ncbi:hypothetical protein BG011_006938 [Mortierella polycephala]|uniref:Uncharacterized protein n=1 Tax=Mortierella polycephala TaxID=41804 RepID=A0A9P6TZA6_9FUNG|nr:hypothetical protein BG011_006938 [Mortierella polycephala]